MNRRTVNGAEMTKCTHCPLRKNEHFREFAKSELAFVSSFKTGELTAEPRATILVEGSHSAHLFTVLNGWGYRYKTLPDGRRQILNYVMPGDLVGLQGSLMGEMQHSVEALTALTLCVFERNRIGELYRSNPGLAYDITWIASREEQILDENLLSVGRRSALERAAYLLAYLHRRATAVGLLDGNRRVIPITQHHVADTLGLSVVHTNKTLRKLSKAGLIEWRDRGCVVLDRESLMRRAGWTAELSDDRPFI